MTMYEQDPDILKWGLHYLLDDMSISGYHGTATEKDNGVYDGKGVRNSNFDTSNATVENDEIIALALQEEFAQVAVAEASGSSHAAEEQASVLAQDWFGPSTRNFVSGNKGGHDEADDMGPSSSCSSPDEKIHQEDLPLELTEDLFSLDGEVGKRLNHVVPVPHVPRINREIPTADEATSDHERLLERLQLYELSELKVQGDGNCQFRALSDQFYRTPEHHKFVRQQVVNQLKSSPEIYEGYVPMAYGDYIKKMSKNGEWGDHVTLQAAADSYGVKIFILTSFKDTCYTEILPKVQRSKRVIFLSFWAEVHYNSIYPEGELPILEAKKKKRWWHFGNKH